MHAIKEDPRGAALPPRTREIVDFAIRLTETPAATDRAALDRLRAHGLSDEDLLMLVHIIGYFNHINRIADALGLDIEDDMPPSPY